MLGIPLTRSRIVTSRVDRGPQPGEMVLSVVQPWAWALVSGVKLFENRTWSTDHRGVLWIHASSSPASPEAGRILTDLCRVPAKELCSPLALARGEVIGCVYLEDVWTQKEVPRWAWANILAAGPVVFFLSAAATLKEPIPAKGALGLWPWKKK